jgi:transcriptional regulator with XRE-family HTH domain
METIFVMGKVVQETLAEFVRRVRNEKGLSTLDVEKLSKFEISDGYVSRIENNGVKNVSPEKLSALAKGLNVTEEEIFAVARQKQPNEHAKTEERFAMLSTKFSELTGQNRLKAEILLEVLERELGRMN